MRRTSLTPIVARYGVFVALVTLIVFGALRYDNFLGLFNVLSLLRYNSMFALVSLGMAFVIMTAGIDLSVGAVAALGSVVAALVSPHGPWLGLIAKSWAWPQTGRRCTASPRCGQRRTTRSRWRLLC